MRENQRNYYLGTFLSIAGDSKGDGEPWGDHSQFKRGQIKGEIDFNELSQVLHGDMIEAFLNLPDRL